MIRLILVFMALSLVQISCQRKMAKQNQGNVLSQELTHEEAQLNPDPLPRFVTKLTARDTQLKELDTLLFYNRTACFGFCPTFNFSIFSNGVILYEGIQHVEPAGRVWSLISEEEWDELMKLIRMADFFELEDVYPVNQREMLVDLPNIHIMVKHDAKRKHITDNHSAPAKLKTLEQAVENKLKSLLPSKE
ncbi:MAG: hypothetical protein IPM48_09535 [Saprospiraceae bacterium]|nr:hypothetical protein [Saprospiraceae bacterium]